MRVEEIYLPESHDKIDEKHVFRKTDFYNGNKMVTNSKKDLDQKYMSGKSGDGETIFGS